VTQKRAIIRKGKLGENNEELLKIGARDDGKEYSKRNHVTQ
jgi:hypothetical protein